jgi:phospholipase/carboxylesterase/glyoxalase family protein
VTARADLGFVYKFVPSVGSRTTLLLLHGTGGDENDLLPIGHQLLPGAALLSPRGRVLENGRPRFFRRLAEGVFDLEDLAIQTEALAQFIKQAAGEHDFETRGVVAVGYSNGANIAGSLLLTEPHLLTAAVLFRPMVPFVPDSPPELKNVVALLAAGRKDPIASPQQISALTKILESGGARVSTHWHDGGHELAQDDLEAAKKWLEEWQSLL